MMPLVVRPAAGRRLPVAVRHADAQAFATQAATMRSRHVGRSPSLVNEDEPVQVELGLALTPGFPLLQNVRTILLRGMGSLFLRVMLWRAKSRRIVP
jgi:hypothetical protein